MSKKAHARTNEVRVMNDFRPAPAGWRVLRFELFSDPIEEYHIQEFVLAGWVIRGYATIPAYWNNGEHFASGDLWEVDDNIGWSHFILGPGEERPSLHDLNVRYHGPGYADRLVATV